MKTIKCPACKREKEIEKNIIMFLCKCGETIEVENGEEKNIL